MSWMLSRLPFFNLIWFQVTKSRRNYSRWTFPKHNHSHKSVNVLVTQLCPILCNPMNYSPPDSSVHGILHTRILERVAIPFSRGSFWPRNQIQVFFIAADSLPSEPPGTPLMNGGKSQRIHNRSQNHWFEDYKIQKWCLVFSLMLCFLFYLCPF